MVIGDNYINSKSFGMMNGNNITCTAVYSNDEFYSFLSQFIKMIGLQSITIMNTVRESVRALDAYLSKIAKEYGS
jgi:hypothetical protein